MDEYIEDVGLILYKGYTNVLFFPGPTHHMLDSYFSLYDKLCHIIYLRLADVVLIYITYQMNASHVGLTSPVYHVYFAEECLGACIFLIYRRYHRQIYFSKYVLFCERYLDSDKNVRILYTGDLVIFAFLNFREFLIPGLFTKFQEFSFFFSSTILKIIFGRFLNLQMYAPCEIREN